MEELLPFVEFLPPHSANTTIWGEQSWQKLYGSGNIVGAIMVGYPGMAGSGGFLSHTLDNKAFECIKVNGKP
jgi:D-aminopeptidase